MTMDEGEIYRNWKAAKVPEEQIKVLADLNTCDERVIREIVEKRKEAEEERVDGGDQSGRAGRPRAITTEMEERMMELYEKGLGDTRIGNEMGVSRSEVSRWRKERGLPGAVRGRKKEDSTALIRPSAGPARRPAPTQPSPEGERKMGVYERVEMVLRVARSCGAEVRAAAELAVLMLDEHIQKRLELDKEESW